MSGSSNMAERTASASWLSPHASASARACLSKVTGTSMNEPRTRRLDARCWTNWSLISGHAVPKMSTGALGGSLRSSCSP